MKTKILYTLLLIISIFTISCTNEPIFYNIAKEVSLLDSVITGNVYSMVEQGDFIYATNGKIFVKGKNQEVTETQNPWKVVEKPAGKITRLASTDTHLYALSTLDPINGSDTYAIYVTSNLLGNTKPTWTKVEVSNAKTIFNNEAPPSTGKLKAYYSTIEGIYELIDGEASSTNLKTEKNIISTKTDEDEKSASCAVKAAYIETDDTTLFSDDSSFCSDRKNTFYKVDEKLIKYSTDKGETWTSVTPDISDSQSACYYEHNGNSWIYVGTAPYDGPGLQVVNLDNNNIPTTTVSEPVGQNVASCLDDTQVIGLYPFPYNTGKLYAASVIIFSTSALSNDNQLWGYYPSRNNWNRE